MSLFGIWDREGLFNLHANANDRDIVNNESRAKAWGHASQTGDAHDASKESADEKSIETEFSQHFIDCLVSRELGMW